MTTKKKPKPVIGLKWIEERRYYRVTKKSTLVVQVGDYSVYRIPRGYVVTSRWDENVIVAGYVTPINPKFVDAIKLIDDYMEHGITDNDDDGIGDEL